MSEAIWTKIFDFTYHHLTTNSEAYEHYYKARLMEVFLSAIYLEPVLAITYMIKKGILESLITLIISKSGYFICDYDRKLLVIGLITLFAAKLRENQVDDLAIKCFECAVLNLHIQRIEQNKAAGYYKSKVVKMPGEIDELRLHADILEKFKEMADLKEEDYEEDDDLHSDNEDEQDKEEMEVLQALMSRKGKAKIALKNFDSKVLTVDEYQTAIDVVKEIRVAFRDADETRGGKVLKVCGWP